MSGEDPIVAAARGLDGRFRRSSVFGPIAKGIVVARDVDQTTGIRATLNKHFPTWDLDEPLPLFLESLAAVEKEKP